MQKKPDLKNIIIFRTDRIGEVLLSTAAIEAVLRRHPDSRISFVTSEYSRPLLEDRADVKEIMTVDTFSKDKWISKALALAVLLRKKKFDVAIILNPHKMLHLACFVAGIPHRVGYDRKWGFLLTDKISDEREQGRKHEVDYTMDLLRLVDVSSSAPAPRLSVNDKARDAVEELLALRGASKSKPLVTIHPGSSNMAKLWPGDRYSKVIRRIKTELEMDVVILGSSFEKTLAEKIIKESNSDVISLVGELDLRQLSAVLKRSVLFIGNDAGPMHMAAALGVPVIAIFGRNISGVSPRRWRPWGEGHIVFHETPGCEPCYDTSCPYDYRCLKAVTADAVFGAVKEITERTWTLRK